MVGVDFSKRLIKYASRELGKTNANVEFVVADLEHLPFKEDVFDVIVFSEVLEHILKQKREAVMRDLLHMISSKGLLFLTTPNAMYLPIFVTKILHSFSRGRLRSSITTHLYDHPMFPRSLIELLKHTGWKVLLYQGTEHRTPFERYNYPRKLPKILFFAIYQLVIATPS